MIVVILYNVITKQENVLLRLTFLKACHLDVIFVKYFDRYRFILYVKRNKSRKRFKRTVLQLIQKK